MANTRTLTAANSVILLSIPGVYNVAQQLQGFATDDVFNADNVDIAEAPMGVDGRLSAGFVHTAQKQDYTIQADSDSILLFEDWYMFMSQANEIFRCQGSTYLPSTQRKYTMANGVLTSYSPMPSAKKIMQPRKFTITWESTSPGNI